MSWVYVAVAAVAVSAFGTIQAGQAAKSAAKYNAAVAEQAAKAASDKAAYDEQRHRESIRKLMSSQRALYGKSGLDMTEGSPLLVMEDTAAQGELDAMAIRYGGDIASARDRSAANLSRMQGAAAVTASYFQAGSTLLSGASSAGRMNMKDASLKNNPVE